jgi:hypothetical protein
MHTKERNEKCRHNVTTTQMQKNFTFSLHFSSWLGVSVAEIDYWSSSLENPG